MTTKASTKKMIVDLKRDIKDGETALVELNSELTEVEKKYEIEHGARVETERELQAGSRRPLLAPFILVQSHFVVYSEYRPIIFVFYSRYRPIIFVPFLSSVRVYICSTIEALRATEVIPLFKLFETERLSSSMGQKRAMAQLVSPHRAVPWTSL